MPNEDTLSLIAVGNICRQWSFFEFLFANVIWWLLKLDRESGVLMTASLDMKGLAQTALELANLKKADPRLIKSLENALKEIEKLIPRRNLTIHGVYSYNSDINQTFIENHRQKNARSRRGISSTELMALGDDIRKSALKLLPVFYEASGLKKI